MIRMFISFNNKREITGFVTYENQFSGYIQEEKNNNYSGYISMVRERKAILESLERGNTLVVERKLLEENWNTMIGKIERTGPSYAGDETFTCEFEARGEFFYSSLDNLNDQICQGCEVDPPKVFSKYTGGFELTLQQPNN